MVYVGASRTNSVSLFQKSGIADISLGVSSAEIGSYGATVTVVVEFTGNVERVARRYTITGVRKTTDGTRPAVYAGLAGDYSAQFDQAFHRASGFTVTIEGRPHGNYSLRGSDRGINALHACAGVTPSAPLAAAPAPARRPPSQPSGVDSFGMLERLIERDSQSWFVNRYVAGSLSGVSSKRLDDQHVRYWANYEFDGSFGRQQGWIAMELHDGEYECHEYWDNDQC